MSHSPQHRPRIFGARHMAASAHYLGAQAAYDVMEAGGNAVEAGVAGGIVLCVVQEEFVNFAGVTPIILKMAGEAPVTISGLGPWPHKADPRYFFENHAGRIPPGLMRTVVPGAPDAWITALERFRPISHAPACSTAPFGIRLTLTSHERGLWAIVSGAGQSISRKLVERRYNQDINRPISRAGPLPGIGSHRGRGRYLTTAN